MHRTTGSGWTRRGTHEEIAHGHVWPCSWRSPGLGSGDGGCTDPGGHRLQRRDAGREQRSSSHRATWRSARLRRHHRGLRRDGAAGRLGDAAWIRAEPHCRRAGTLTVDGARANPTAARYDAGRSLDFAATFMRSAFQHVGFGEDLQRRAVGDVQHRRGGTAAWGCTRDVAPEARQHADRRRRSAGRARLQHRMDPDRGPVLRRRRLGGDPCHRDHPRCARSPVTQRWRRQRAGRVPGPLLVSGSGHLHLACLRRRRQPRHLADAERGARSPPATPA